MKMFLLASAVALLVCSAVTKPTPNPQTILKMIIDLATTYTEGGINKDGFVEDLSKLVEEGCRDIFFCKGHHILHNENKEEKRIAAHMKKFVDGRNQNCTALINKAPSSNVTITIGKLLEQVMECSRHRNMNHTTK